MTFDQTMRLGKGGEGFVYILPNEPNRVAKIYHPGKATPERCRKIEVMVNNPPTDPMQSKGHASIAWPTEILEYTGQTGAGLVSGQVIGFIMPRMGKQMSTIVDFYDPKSRIKAHPAFSYNYLLNTARNFVSAVRAIHAKGYVIGDVNESNIMVDDSNTYITLVDTDSFQVTDHQAGIIYRCPVGKEDFTPPELQGKNFSQIDRALEHDLFGVGVILFQLLMENSQPFGGVFTDVGDPPEYGSRIRKGYFTHCKKRKVPFKPSPLAPPFDMLHPEIQQLFIRCFEDGHTNPSARPTAKDWLQAISTAIQSITRCNKNGQHFFDGHLTSCLWCERAQRLGIDSFPSQNQARATQQVFTPKPRRPVAQAQPSNLFGRAVTPPPAPIIHNLQASSSSIVSGQSCTLTWHVTNVQSVVINNGIGTVVSNGSVTVSPTTNTTYTLTAQGLGGTATRAVSIMVTKPTPILSFTANSFSVTLGRPITLRWNVAPNQSVKINKGIGSVANIGQRTLIPTKAMWGLQRLVGKTQITYVLTAKGSKGTFKQKLSIDISLPPLPVVLNNYVALNFPSVNLQQYHSLNPLVITLKAFSALANFVRLQTFGRLQPITVSLNNYIALRKPPTVKPSLSAMPFYQRIPIKAFNKIVGWVQGIRKIRRTGKTIFD